LPPLPIEEGTRLAALRRLEVLEPAEDAQWEGLVLQVRRALRAPVGQVSFVDDQRVRYRASQGLALAELPRAVAFCSVAILEDRTLVVPDAQRDPRFRDNPIVAGAPAVRFYAGHPITAPGGELVGAVCVMDFEPRELHAAEAASLQLAAQHASLILASRVRERTHHQTLEALASARAMSPRDPDLELWSRDTALDAIARLRERATRRHTPLAVLRIDLDDFGAANVRCGRAAGDSILREVARRLQVQIRPYDVLGRMRDDEFIVAMADLSCEQAQLAAERLVRAIGGEPYTIIGGERDVTASAGLAFSRFDAHPFSATALASHAEQALGDAKMAGKNQVSWRSL
jgi:diguanylate cyclase (GGDEF)-like protein